MNLQFLHRGRRYESSTQLARSIAIELDFDGPQPNLFGCEKARKQTLRVGQFIGDTTSGGSCNVDMLSLTPHCNGTHTESIGHIVSENFPVGELALNPIQLAVLVTVQPIRATQSSDSYRPELNSTDQVIDAAQIATAIEETSDLQPDALIVRTRPNDPKKQTQVYGEANQPAFFTIQAIQAINDLGIQHLLTDLPSIDRLHDDGLLSNHHLFWNVAAGTHSTTTDSHPEKTITEMIYVDDEFADGVYGLSLQVPSFGSDAAASRPVIWPFAQIRN